MKSYDKEQKQRMSDFEFLILHSLFSLQGQRSIFGLYHMIQGKRSAQSIQDGHLFRLLPIFALLPHLQKNELEKGVMQLYEQSLIRKLAHQVYCLTYEGEQFYNKYKKESLLPTLNGWAMKDIARDFSLRLSLFIQALSQLAAGNHRFIPNTKNYEIQAWVSQHFPKVHRRDEVRKQLFIELSEVLHHLDRLGREIFIRKLSGAHRYGYTNEQLSVLYNMPIVDVELRYVSILHQLIGRIMKREINYPVLSRFLEQKKQRTLLTESAEQTLNMYKKGASLQEIINRRRLKQSTIEDHFVEAFFYDQSLCLRPFVSEVDERRILQAIKEKGRGKLKAIKEHVPEQISYFQIRLVLAKEGLEQ